MWKYINPGDYRFLHNHNGTSYSNLSDPSQFKKTGIGYTTQTLEDYPIRLPNDTTEIWFKADISVNDETTIVFHSRTTVYGVVLRLSPDGWRLAASHRAYSTEDEKWGPTNTTRAESMNLDGQTVSVLLHIRGAAMDESSIFNIANGLVELRLNNRIVAKMENLAIMNGEYFQLQTMTSERGDSYFSNIIASTEQLVLRENVYMLPIASTVAEGWTKTTQNGIDVYITDNVNKSIVQTIDAEALRTALGEDISITSVVMQAFDLSSNDEEVVDSIQKIIKVNDEEHLMGTTLMTSSNYISEAITKNPATNAPWTFSDLASAELILRTAKSSA